MRNAVPMRWIEQAEAREVITASLFQLPPPQHSCGIVRDVARQVLSRLAAWFAARQGSGWPMLRMQPALVRAKPGAGDLRQHANGDY